MGRMQFRAVFIDNTTMGDWVSVDGSAGEGGGQMVRTALALSLVTRRPFRMSRIRARRHPPGLRPQHLVAVSAAAEIGRARVEGATIGSPDLVFQPKDAEPGEYNFAIGTAGSTLLVLQTLLPALMLARAPSTLVLEGGTHNPLAPTFEFVVHAFVPLINRMGPRVTLRLERAGFYPRGGGRLHVAITPSPLAALVLPTRGEVRAVRAAAMIAGLPRHIGERELNVAAQALGIPAAALALRELPRGSGPGNAIIVEVEAEHVTEVFAGIGERGVPAETVAWGAVDAARRYLAADVPVGEHLADQLLIPCALARGRSIFRSLAPTPHTRTNIDVVRMFLPVPIEVVDEGGDACAISVGAAL